MAQHTRIPDLADTVQRVTREGFFPSSPAAVVREATFSDILAEVLATSPSESDITRLYEELQSHPSVDNEDLATQLWDIFLDTYTTSGQRGARGKEANRYLIPFHPAIAKHFKPQESRNWGRWYRMLMTSGRPPQFNNDLHEQFVDRLDSLNPSNLFEEVIVNAAENIETEEIGEIETQPIRPYIEACALRFQEDLRHWLDDTYESPSQWLQSTRDLICFHFMMYFVQLSVNLRLEFEAVQEGEAENFDPTMRPIHFGLWDERATQDRGFANEWWERGPRGVEGDVYDSWGRLAVMHILTETATESSFDIQGAWTLSEAMDAYEPAAKAHAVEKMYSYLDTDLHPRDRRDLAAAAQLLVQAVRKHYESKSESNQTPISMGINVVRQLGSGQDRRFFRSQQRIGKTFRLNRSSLRFFARLFHDPEEDSHIEEFWRYLRRRGIALDSRSENEALEELGKMGMIDRQSDSGGAVYVRSI
ncbi:DNA phosphorothioation-dependent restriction protein DptG [Halorarius litoreus]|uniref:DNA phosphorothioation-dependent restriction protein DptG n=1 Tax=Halorarius litoreus TaxID=2962676 RepID=UPI0020CC1125|nr:DNA phosphorothioation-dependent restriction protein DptG [Halorarius litoreus]